MQASALTVSDLNEYVRRSLAGDPMLRSISVRGEVSNFKPYASGHWYFTLKDEGSRLSCVMFRQHNMGLRFLPRDGAKVILKGSAGLYVASGSYQFYAEGMQEDGVGELYIRYNELKEKLQKEGLFDTTLKRPLPLLPRAVGVVTSESGAVLHDIQTVIRRRFPNMPVVLRPAQVQGAGAEMDLAQGLAELASVREVDVIIIGRGGGSIEDLWAFNEEILVRAIAACPKPVISAVGHETDTTLADFAADMRAPTPSAAAELAVPDKHVMIQRLLSYQRALHAAALHQQYALVQRLQGLQTAMSKRSPEKVLQELVHRHALVGADMNRIVENLIENYGKQLQMQESLLKSLGPGKTLDRGYAMLLSGGRVLTSVDELPEQFDVLLQDGRARVKKISVERGTRDDRARKG